MISKAIAAAREDMVIRELRERAELREVCLEALRARIRAGNHKVALAAVSVGARGTRGDGIAHESGARP